MAKITRAANAKIYWYPCMSCDVYVSFLQHNSKYMEARFTNFVFTFSHTVAALKLDPQCKEVGGSDRSRKYGHGLFYLFIFFNSSKLHYSNFDSAIRL